MPCYPLVSVTEDSRKFQTQMPKINCTNFKAKSKERVSIATNYKSAVRIVYRK